MGCLPRSAGGLFSYPEGLSAAAEPGRGWEYRQYLQRTLGLLSPRCRSLRCGQVGCLHRPLAWTPVRGGGTPRHSDGDTGSTGGQWHAVQSGLYGAHPRRSVLRRALADGPRVAVDAAGVPRSWLSQLRWANCMCIHSEIVSVLTKYFCVRRDGTTSVATYRTTSSASAPIRVIPAASCLTAWATTSTRHDRGTSLSHPTNWTVRQMRDHPAP